MKTSRRQQWIRAAILVGVVYAVVGIGFAAPANSAVSDQVRVAWRLAAWVVSAAAYAAHIGYEHFRLHNKPMTTAWHTAGAVALGAFALAASANIHALLVGTGIQSVLIALVVWPVLAAVPAFVVALVATTGLTFVRRPG